MGAAFATLAATLVFKEKWHRQPDAVVTFAGPRLADQALSDWWEQNGFCNRLLRVQVYNDVVHWLPFAKQSELATTKFANCLVDMKSCFHKQLAGRGEDHFNKWWRHVCPSS